MYTSHVDPASILYLLSLDFNFLTQKVSTINIKKALARFDRPVGSSGGRGKDGEAMLLPELSTTDFAPCIPDGKAPTSAPSCAVLVYGSDILTRIFGSSFRNSSITETVENAVA